MNQSLAARITVLAAFLPNRCPGCRDWPTFWILTELSPAPPTECPDCGRRPRTTPVRLIGVDPAEI
jgi:hypothetical protein